MLASVRYSGSEKSRYWYSQESIGPESTQLTSCDGSSIGWKRIDGLFVALGGEVQTQQEHEKTSLALGLGAVIAASRTKRKKVR